MAYGINRPDLFDKILSDTVAAPVPCAIVEAVTAVVEVTRAHFNRFVIDGRQSRARAVACIVFVTSLCNSCGKKHSVDSVPP